MLWCDWLTAWNGDNIGDEVTTRSRNVVVAVIFGAVAFCQDHPNTATSSISVGLSILLVQYIPNPSVKLSVFGATEVFAETKANPEGLFSFPDATANKYTVRIEVTKISGLNIG